VVVVPSIGVEVFVPPVPTVVPTPLLTLVLLFEPVVVLPPVVVPPTVVVTVVRPLGETVDVDVPPTSPMPRVLNRPLAAPAGVSRKTMLILDCPGRKVTVLPTRPKSTPLIPVPLS
jgi:hypothetical protein